jgi:alanine dehydrogenase
MSERLKSDIKKLAQTREFLHPQEMLLKEKTSNRNLFIGLPKEIARQENRIALRPEAVMQLVNQGHEVWVETGAGKGSKHSDYDYSNVGAKIAYSPEEIYSADLLVKIAPPTLEDIELMKPKATLISALQIGSLTPDLLLAMNSKRITGIAYELIEDKVGGLPFVRAMSEIAGSTVMLIAAEYLSSVHDGKGIILGGIVGVPPTKVVILGAGTVAEYAARTAVGLGASLKIFDQHLYKLRRIKQMLNNYQLYTSPLESMALQRALKSADLVIAALRPENGRSPCVVTEEMVQEMQPNSVIIDVSIDHGGCFETSEVTSHQNPVFKKYDVIHYCVPNIPSRVARTASTAFSNIILPLLLQISKRGGIEEMIYTSQGFSKGVYCHQGELTNESIARKYNMRFRDLGLLIGITRF